MLFKGTIQEIVSQISNELDLHVSPVARAISTQITGLADRFSKVLEVLDHRLAELAINNANLDQKVTNNTTFLVTLAKELSGTAREILSNTQTGPRRIIDAMDPLVDRASAVGESVDEISLVLEQHGVLLRQLIGQQAETQRVMLELLQALANQQEPTGFAEVTSFSGYTPREVAELLGVSLQKVNTIVKKLNLKSDPESVSCREDGGVGLITIKGLRQITAALNA